MKLPFRRFALLAALLLAGCGDVAERVRARLPMEAPPQVQTFAADPRATYAAALAAARQMGFRFTRGGPAQGRLEAISTVAAGEQPGSAHQYSLAARFHPSLDGTGTELSLRITEIVEDDSERRQGEGTETALRDSSLYRTFFRAVAQLLGTK